MPCMYESDTYSNLLDSDYLIAAFDMLGCQKAGEVCRHLLIIYNPDETFSIPTNGNLLDEYLRCFYG